MCGIAGIFRTGSDSVDALKELALRMARSIEHRGPDDEGAWADPEHGVAFGHRRLSIVDLSAAGHQPMTSSNGRYVIAFNGEIYNHMEVRAQLDTYGAAPAWRGHSDTETLLAGFERWGIRATLEKCVGMFAIALWDARDKVLSLARDRFGEKPLYYGWVGGDFVFGSELKALKACTGFNNQVSRLALAQYMRFIYVPAPFSIYEGIYKLEPGCLLTITGHAPSAAPANPLRSGDRHDSLTIERWWSMADVVRNGAQNQVHTDAEAIERLEATLRTAVHLQSLADVPLGAFLSGGVDSSTIVSLMQEESSRPVRTFTIGFTESEFDESRDAAAIAKHLGTEHSTLMVTPREAQAVIPLLPAMYDEPFADSSQIPTHLVCRAAREQVTVALSGDAGDEMFGGYNRYFWGPRIWSRLSWLPQPVRRGLGAAICGVPISAWDGVGRVSESMLPNGATVRRLGDKAHKLGARLRSVNDMDDLYLSLVSEWQDPAAVVEGVSASEVSSAKEVFTEHLKASQRLDGQSRMMYLDATTYLPDDILCKVDRAAMAVSLETRVPFLDHRVAELAWQLPINMKIRTGEGKWALRQVLYRRVPRELIERPKSGFGVPVGEWLRGPLRAWAEELLEPQRLQREGYFKCQPIHEAWNQHITGQRDWTHRLWTVLMFQSWLEANR